MADNKITFSKEEVQMMMMKSFVKGEEWGVFYSGWLNPSEEAKANTAANNCEDIYQEALIDKL
jgi:hypothetical protein